ncbi:Amuc_1100 family pilus-like protein [Pelagicoccus sp. SDUM812003]|uniref:Amuc_1100 family pilus-like protein n=1 Tax=Pelagicoccus sp. SDUM812003 TaxID=3041267 RepID=UPI00280FAC19|nr:Amuc_1100 family pilus-like protein [Pelagicoccus sp. SDUM812003]MDQ8204475.1 Amuc_1100 family pilus-like protein [Pelagicoccus sp. SDUM812003]
MEFFKRNPVFYTALFILLAIAVAGLWILARLDGRLRELKADYRTMSEKYDRYLAARPSPTRSNLQALKENYEELYDAYQKTLRSLNLNTYDREEFFGRTPVSRADWSFELHKFKENARYAALSNGVELPASVHFGFEDYADGGPPPKDKELVHRQVMIMSDLLATLFSSGIESFVKIQRGVKKGTSSAGRVTVRTDERIYNEGDEFLVTEEMSASIPEVIGAQAFRVVFRGQSIALRNFLNRLADSSLPYVIRGVEVDLASEGGVKKGLNSVMEGVRGLGESRYAAADTSVPIIADNTSLYVVTIEFMESLVDFEAPEEQQSAVESEADDA